MPVRNTKKFPGKKEEPVAGKITRPENYVYMGKSFTKNMGNYNSTKIDLGLTVQVDPTPEELAQIKKTISVVDKVLSDEMTAQLKEFE